MVTKVIIDIGDNLTQKMHLKGLWVCYNLELKECDNFDSLRSNLDDISVFVLGIDDEVAIVSGERVLVQVGTLPGGSGGDALHIPLCEIS